MRIALIMMLAAACAFGQADPVIRGGTSNTTVYANRYTGADCGAKINAASTALSTAPGEIWATEACGAISTAVSLPVYHVLRIVGAHNQSAVITACHVQGIGFGGAHSAGAPPSQLTQTAASNLTSMITINCDAGSVRDLYLNGAKATNAGNREPHRPRRSPNGPRRDGPATPRWDVLHSPGTRTSRPPTFVSMADCCAARHPEYVGAPQHAAWDNSYKIWGQNRIRGQNTISAAGPLPAPEIVF